jgi:AcrR family transcriptional regulator
MAAMRAGAGPQAFPYFAEFIEGRRGEILDAALVVFGEKGYEAGTMREIAKRVGVSEPAIYRHYESKEAILGDIVATAGDRIAGEMRAAFDTVTAENIVPRLHALLEMRRHSLTARPVAQPPTGEIVGAETLAPPALRSGAGGVLHMLFHAAPHNATFIGLLRAHLGTPMVEAVRATVPRVDAGFGIERSREELDAKVRVFMSLFAGYFTTSLLLDAPPNDAAIVDALLAIMSWKTA